MFHFRLRRRRFEMDLKCEYPCCNTTFFWSGRGRRSRYCIPHRKKINQQQAIAWNKVHYRSKSNNISQSDPEAIVRPLVSHKFIGPGLFEHLNDLINRALIVKSHALGMPKSFMIEKWLPGQAGQQFVKSFMHPGML